jgi:rRNA pseudouridine-1189 N-methylase Emg1 (Nep1/Mra1 family)
MYKLLTEKNIAITGMKDTEKTNSQFQDKEKTYLIKNIRLTLPGLIKTLNPHRIFRFTSKGTLNKPSAVFQSLTGDETVIGIIGGFQSGFFSDQIMELDAEDISIYPHGLETDAVVNRVIINFENSLKLED